MNEKAQALVDALRGVGISCNPYQCKTTGWIYIDIDHSEDDDEAGTCEWNTHIKWSLGENKGFSFRLDANGIIEAIVE